MDTPFQKLKSRDQQAKRGFSLIEVLLAGSIFVLLVTALVGAYLYGNEAAALAGNRGRAVFIAQEGLEAVRNMRDQSFGNIPDGMYGLSTSSNQWSFAGSQDTVGIFTRQIVISSIDAKRKSVTANVTWQQNAQRSGIVSLPTRLNNWIARVSGNWASPIQAGSMNISGNNNGRKIQAAGNNVVMILSGGNPNFFVINVSNPASPSTIGSLNLTGTPTNIAVSDTTVSVSNTSNGQELQIIDISTPSAPSVVGVFNAPGNADANGVFANGTMVYFVRQNSAQNEFFIINATTPSAPYAVGSLNLSGNGNEVFVSGNYALIASSNNSQELQIINISAESSPTIAGSLNLPGAADALTVGLTGTTALMGQGGSFTTVNVSNPGSPTILGSITDLDSVNDIAINLGNLNTNAYLATSSNAAEFRVVDISNPSAPSVIGSVNASTNENLLGMAYHETLDLAFASSASDSEEFIIFAPQ